MEMKAQMGEKHGYSLIQIYKKADDLHVMLLEET